MLAVYMGIYIFLLAIIWGFFLVARHHSYKFKDFSTNIVPVTNILFFFIFILSVVGFFLVLSLDGQGKLIEIDTQKETKNIYY